MAESKDELNFRKGDDEMKCQLCANWGAEGKCSVLEMITAPQMLCDGFVSVEGDVAAGAPADEAVAGEVPPEMLAAIFGAG